MSMRENAMMDSIEELDKITVDEALQLAEEGIKLTISNGHVVGIVNEGGTEEHLYG